MIESGVELLLVTPGDAETLSELLRKNRWYLEPWMPARDDEWYQLAPVEQRLRDDLVDHASGTAYHFKIVVTGRIVGRLDMTTVVRGVWRNTNLGYWVSEGDRGRGYAADAVRAAVAFAFQEMSLHRVQAAVIPRNRASIRVVEKAGFRREGMAERYLLINGRWEDHLIYAITAEEWSTGRRAG